MQVCIPARTGRVVVLALTLVSLFLSGCHQEQTETGRLEQAATMTVTTQPVENRNFERRLIVTGTVEPWQTLTVSAEINGLKILSIPYEVGDLVPKGAVLVSLNDQELRAQLAAAQARYDAAVANVELARTPNRAQDIAALEAAVQQATAVVRQEEAALAQTRINQSNAARSAARYEQALTEGYVTALETDQRITDRESQEAAIRASEQRIQAARSSLEQARQNLQLAQAQGRSEDVAAAEARRSEAAASVQQIQAQLERTRIVAPDSGLILTQKAYLGDVVTIGQGLLTMARQGRLQLWATVPQQELNKLLVGQKVQFGPAEDKRSGTIEEIDPDIDATTRQGRVRISLAGDSELKAGAFLEGQVTLPNQDVAAVLYESVGGTTEQPSVFLLDGQKARRVSVRLGERHGQWVEVLEGLKVGQEVVVSGAAFLNDGDPVRVATAAKK